MPSSQPTSRKSLVAVVLASASALLIAIAVAFGGHVAGIGAALGLAGTGASVMGTWAGIQFLGRLMQGKPAGWQGVAVPITFMVIKLPAILAAMFWALRLGPPAPAWFLAGLALVYSGLVWWALTRE